MLKTCGKEACNPVEQVRGKMGPGDYADVIIAHRYVPPWDTTTKINAETAQDLHLHVEVDESGKDDFRICCLTCGKATGWNKSDAPGMPGVGRDFTRKRWNEGMDNVS
jgi:hypothetical protein